MWSDAHKCSGWFGLDNKVFDMALGPYEFFVYAFLVRIADRSSRIARISTANLARKLGISRQKVIHALQELRARNMIRVQAQTGKTNIYTLTFQDEWVSTRWTGGVHQIDRGCLPDRQGVSTRCTGGVYQIDNPPTEGGGETLEHQGLGKLERRPINNNIIKNTYIKNHHHNIYADVDAEIEKSSFTSSDGKSANTNPDSYSKDENPSKEKKPSAFVNSAAALETARKWNLQTLSPEQAAFFLLNSRLSPEITEKEILKADRSDVIRNPIGYLISTLMVDTKRAKHKELLLVERQDQESESEESSLEVDKFLNETAGKLGVDVSDPFEVKRKKLARVVFKRMFSEEDREHVLKNIKNVPENIKEEVFTALVWAKYLRSLPEGAKKRMFERALV